MAFVLHTFPIKASQRGWPSEALGAGIIPVPERGGGTRKGGARYNFDPVRLDGVTDLPVEKGPMGNLGMAIHPALITCRELKVLGWHG